jgi:protoporphyrinogen oxidase
LGDERTASVAAQKYSRVGVIGAGPAGLTAAYQLSKHDFQVDLYEASPGVGGMCRTVDLWGQKVDLGPHRFFSSDPRVNRLWLELAGEDYDLVDRLTRILYKGRLFHYPLRFGNVLSNLGVLESVHCALSYLKEKLWRTGQDGSFEDWVVSRFGRRLYEIFFEAYSEKLWGVTGKELDQDFAQQRIKKLSFFEAVRNALFQGRGNTHKTLVDQFAYPLRGTGQIYRQMAKRFQSNGGNLHLNTPVGRVVREGARAIGLELEGGERVEYDHIISSMPLTLMVNALDDVPPLVAQACERLRFRNTVLVYLRVDATELFDDNWLYIHSPEIRCGRITNFRNWVPHLYGKDSATILALEYWCNSEDPVWGQPDEEWGCLAREDLKRSGLADAAHVSEHEVIRIHRCYPVYRRGYMDELDVLHRFLATVGDLQVIGRYGSFKYNNQDHSILMGLLAAENVAAEAKHDLWNINTDYEYQEKALITKTGLKFVEKAAN